MKKNRIIALLLAGFTAIESAVIPVHAGSVTDDIPVPFAFRLAGETEASYSDFTRHSYNGQPAYCIEPWEHVGKGDVYSEGGLEAWNTFFPWKRETVMLASVFGEGYQNRTGDLWYAATQDVIWDLTDASAEWRDNNAEVKNAADQIRSSIEAYRKDPDFRFEDTVENRKVGKPGKDAVLQDGVPGRMYKVTDEAGVIRSLHTGKADGLKVFDENRKEINASEISSDTFYIRNDQKNGEGTLSFTGIPGSNRFTNIPFIVYGNSKDPKAQKHIVTGSIEPRKFQLKMTTSDVPVDVRKTNEKGNGLSGASLSLEQNGKVLDSWTSDGWIHSLKLQIGETYQIRETDAPDGYYCKDFTLQVSEDYRSEDIMNISNDQKIRYEILKTDEKNQPVKGAKLALYDMTDGSARLVRINDKKGNPWITDEKARDISSYLHVGHTYSVVEEDVSTEYFLAEDARFTVSKYAPEGNPMITEKMTDNHIVYRFAKVDESGKPVTDAELRIYDLDDNGREICCFTTGDQPTDVVLLKRGRHYRLAETRTPEGRFTMEEKEFTVPVYHNAGPITITGIDYSIMYYADKTDESGQPVAGANMEIRDVTTGSDQPVDSFVTTGRPYLMKGLMAGHRYILHEVSSPTGYFLADDVAFTVPEHGTSEPAYVRATDHTIHLPVRKTDTDGHPLADIVLEVFEKETGKPIGSWRTKPDTDIEIGHLVENGKEYILRETESVNGYYFHKDIKFKVPQKYTKDMNIAVTMADEPVHIQVLKEDESGKPLAGAHITLQEKNSDEVIHEWDTVTDAHDISSFVYPGKTYVLKETEIAGGHYEAVEQEFTVNRYPEKDNPLITLKMTDETTRYEIAKVDESGKPVRGVHLKVTDVRTGEVKDEWDTDDHMHELTGVLNAGETYLLEETEWVNGVIQAQDMQFTVPRQGTSAAIRIEMVDETLDLAFLKTDDTGRPLPGATLSVLDAEKNEICSFVSTEDPHGVSSLADGTPVSSLLKGGSTYTLHEKVSPQGYAKAEDISFTANGTLARPQLVSMTDRKAMIWIHLIKTDAADPEKKLKGARFQIYHSEDDSVVKDPDGNDVVLITDADGNAWLSLIYDPKGYYVRETEAPEGYQLTDQTYDVTLSDQNGFSEETPVVIEVTNEQEVPTGTTADWRILTGAGCLLLSVCLALRHHLKKS